MFCLDQRSRKKLHNYFLMEASFILVVIGIVDASVSNQKFIEGAKGQRRLCVESVDYS